MSVLMPTCLSCILALGPFAPQTSQIRHIACLLTLVLVLVLVLALLSDYTAVCPVAPLCLANKLFSTLLSLRDLNTSPLIRHTTEPWPQQDRHAAAQ